MDPELLPRHPCRTTGLSVSDGKRGATADDSSRGPGVLPWVLPLQLQESPPQPGVEGKSSPETMLVPWFSHGFPCVFP